MNYVGSRLLVQFISEMCLTSRCGPVGKTAQSKCRVGDHRNARLWECDDPVRMASAMIEALWTARPLRTHTRIGHTEAKIGPAYLVMLPK